MESHPCPPLSYTDVFFRLTIFSPVWGMLRRLRCVKHSAGMPPSSWNHIPVRLSLTLVLFSADFSPFFLSSCLEIDHKPAFPFGHHITPRPGFWYGGSPITPDFKHSGVIGHIVRPLFLHSSHAAPRVLQLSEHHTDQRPGPTEISSCARCLSVISYTVALALVSLSIVTVREGTLV